MDSDVKPLLLMLLFLHMMVPILITGATSASASLSSRLSPTGSPSPSSSASSTGAPHSSPSSAMGGPLDPKQVTALQSLNLPTSKDPCSDPPPPALHNATLCDDSRPFRHLVSLRLSNCSDDVSLSLTALRSLSTLRVLQLLDCPVPAPLRLPSDLASNLRSFTCVRSLRRLTGVWLSRLPNLTDLTVIDVPLNASGPSIILSGIPLLKSLTISGTGLPGFLPRSSWHHPNLTHIDLSSNQIKGRIHSSITALSNLVSLNLSSNQLSGQLPQSIGDLIHLTNLSLSSNSLSGPIPESLAAMPFLAHIDLSSNQLNGTIPKFIADLKQLKYLNLEKNNFQGVMPFNASFIKRLFLFKVGDNTNLCYNHSTVSSKMKLRIAPCDKNGFPLSPPAKTDTAPSPDDGTDSDYDDSGDDSSQKDKGDHHGPNKVVLGVAIGLSSLIFLIIFLILVSKRCV
ncbi:hypothetical protein Droror1_Dr00010328 [Drosera rotundifolia]